MPSAFRAALAALLTGGLACSHTHPEAPAAEAHEPVTSHTLFSARHELFVEHPLPVVGEPIEFLAHLTELASGAPVTAGEVEVIATSATDRETRAHAAAPRRAGLFVPELTLGEPGVHRLSLTLSGPPADTFDLGEVVVHADAAAALAAAPADDPAHDELTFLLEQQWRIGVLLHEVGRARLVERVQVPGRVVPRHGSAAHVTPPVAGAIVAPPAGLPELGDRVERGQLLAQLRPPLPITEAAALAVNRAQLQALRRELLLRRTDLQVRVAELDAEITTLDTRVEYAGRALERVAELRGKGLATDQEVDAAAAAHGVAGAERTGLMALREQVRAALDALLAMHDAAAEPGDAPVGGDDALLLPLRAPIDGLLARAECIEGQFFEISESVFEIVDSGVVWVEARVPEFDLPRLDPAPSALLRIPGHDEFMLDLASTPGARLVHAAPTVDTATHSAPLLFEVPNADGRLRIGMSLDVFLEAASARAALAIPRDAVVMEAGEATAWVLLGGESFQKRYLRLGIEDGERVEVIRGLAEGERVVSRGAYTLRLASLAPAGIIADHHH